ncbi:hypothetical protein OSTOST_06626 [Ostertagia ostertagi]
MEAISEEKPADEGKRRSLAVKKYDFGAISDAVIKDIEGKMNYRVNRLLRVMVDLLHPDARSLLDCIGVSCEEFYRLCSRFAKVDFSSARDLDITSVDEDLLQRLYERIIGAWLGLSFNTVPLLSEKALLADNLINFSRLDLDIFQAEGIDPHKELAMIFDVADDFRNVPELHTKRYAWLMLRESMNSGFGEVGASWLSGTVHRGRDAMSVLELRWLLSGVAGSVFS